MTAWISLKPREEENVYKAGPNSPSARQNEEERRREGHVRRQRGKRKKSTFI